MRYPEVRTGRENCRVEAGRDAGPRAVAVGAGGVVEDGACTMSVEVRILGPLAVLAGGVEIALDSRKQRLLFAALVVAAPRAVPAERLVDLLWPDELPAEPASALQVHVSRLRRAIGGGSSWIATDPHGYRLELQACGIDAARFEDGLNEARRASEPSQALARAEAALALWRGAALAEFAGLAFARSEAARLEELRVAAEELRAEALVALDRHDEAVPALERLAAEHPLRERPRELLMRALYHLGRQADALAACRQYRQLLSSELGIDPSPSLDRLEREILGHTLAAARGAEGHAGAEASPGEDAALRAPRFEIGYVDADGRRLAVGWAGDGPTLVVLPGFVSNLGTIAAGRDFRSPMLARLAEHLRLVAYDRFGTGLSPGPVEEFALEASVREVEAMLNSLGEKRVALLGISASGPIAVALAARRPQLVSHLVLLGTYARGYDVFGRRELFESILGLVWSHWGLGSKLLTDLMYPSATTEFARLFARGQREAAPAEIAAGYLEAMFEADVSPLLAKVATPALVVHYTGDRAIPFAGGRALAAGLTGARFVPLGGSMHLPEGEDAARVAREIIDFVC